MLDSIVLWLGPVVGFEAAMFVLIFVVARAILREEHGQEGLEAEEGAIQPWSRALLGWQRNVYPALFACEACCFGGAATATVSAEASQITTTKPKAMCQLVVRS